MFLVSERRTKHPRSQKVKCDEGQPSCHQCRRRGLECPGYKRGLHWVQHRELSGSGLKVITTPKNRTKSPGHLPLADAAETEPGQVPSGLESGLWSVLLGVLDVEEQEQQQQPLDRDLFLLASPTADAKEDHGHGSSPRDQPFQAQSTDIQEMVPYSKHGYDNDLGNDPDPPRNHPSIRPSVQDTTTFLVEYYFSNVCPLLSCFDSPSNPFRFEIANMIRSSPALSNCIQAMSAAHLSQLQPSRHREGLELQNAAVRSISDSVANLAEVSEDLMISVILLGVTQPWHDRYATGSEHFAGARTLCAPWLSKQIARGPSAQIDFIIPMLIYWEMLASFVMEDGSGVIECLESYHFGDLNSSGSISTSTLLSNRSARPQTGGVSKIKPHPITGATPEIFVLFAKVGHLVRRRTLELQTMGKSIDSNTDKWDHWSACRPQALKEVEEVEEALLTYETLLLKNVECTNDTRTPVADLLHIAEAYRCAALLQVYRAFPSLLRMRLSSVQDQSGDSASPLSALPEGDYPICLPSPSDTSANAPENSVDQFLFALATKILKSIAETSTESGTRTIMPLILVMAANELRLPKDGESESESASTSASASAPDGRETNGEEPHSDSVAYWRRFLWSRLNGCVRYLSVQPMNTTLDIVKELWKELDSGRRVFWLEVVLENGWETLMG
ncbi:hypothetical protein A1O3_06730 [Capronia epimyces CBS 606.96]|uniref:Zn(2)-C6 fungal-type domain-containing protein n=1 Tax=Capronia epimyces CBS 606.96 TaxID=1182542 RepID=W9YKX9_9EURO|nr:uncharacterized protein A1O3_06730 [Capronia epimyces CBS 606.96]EXJ82914.1 hypothetical protein A1O3_06730 [Capronia epimyces CBS 606.96]